MNFLGGCTINFAMKFKTLCGLQFNLNYFNFNNHFINSASGVPIGAQYNTIGLIRESESFVSVLKEIQYFSGRKCPVFICGLCCSRIV